jgi:hypothetical protein
MPPFTPWIVPHATSWNESYLNKALHFHSGLKDFCDACTQGQYPPQCLWRAPPASRRAFTIIGRARVFKGADRAFLSVATRLLLCDIR